MKFEIVKYNVKGKLHKCGSDWGHGINSGLWSLDKILGTKMQDPYHAINHKVISNFKQALLLFPIVKFSPKQSQYTFA